MSTIDSRPTCRITRARGYLPRASIRRTWPPVAHAFGIKRTLTGITFDEAIRRMKARPVRPSILDALTPELMAEIEAYEGPWLLGRDAPLRESPPAE